MRKGLQKHIESAHVIIANGNQMELNSQEQLGTMAYKLQKIMNEIDVELSNYIFESDRDEITFFKTQLTPVLSECLYCREVLLLQIGITSYAEGIKEYCMTNIKRYLRFKEQNINRFAYYSGRQCDEDHVLFVRSTSESPIDFCESRFSNIPNQTLARASFLAIDKLIPYLQEICKSFNTAKEPAESRFKWTGSDVIAVEMLYLLKSAKLINDGAVCLSELASSFDEAFGTTIKNQMYRTFTDIKKRKQEDPSIVKVFRETYSGIIEASNI